jgi:hypothetical protein
MNRRECHAKRAFHFFQFTWTIRCSIMVTRSLKNLPREGLNELHTHLSPDISPCDFWLFGMLKHTIKDREFQNQQAIFTAIAQSWADLIFADVQSAFPEWMEHLTWVVGNNGEYYPNSRHQFRKWYPVQWKRPERVTNFVTAKL